jgi:hypothetical protein
MFPALWVDSVGQSLADHAALLSQSPPPLSSDGSLILEMISKAIGNLYQSRDTIIPYSSLPRPRLSQKAGFVKLYDAETNRWRTMEGTRAAQHERLGYTAEELTAMTYTPQTGVQEIKQIPYAFDWSEWDFDPEVAIVALQEPFKIRTISIADGPATAAGSPLQKMWHSVMRKLKPFQLIGGVPVPDALQSIKWTPDLPWVSGDYSAATDRLSMRATQIVFNGLTSRVALPTATVSGGPVSLRDRLEASLMHSVMDYSGTLDTFQKRVPEALLDSIDLPEPTLQTNGQLMGNILSFPILCIVNLCTYLLADSRMDPGSTVTPIRRWLNDYRTHGWLPDAKDFNSLAVLVNGDDILFQARPDFYETWLAATSEFGFKPSVGKNYYTPHFLTVNSQMFTTCKGGDILEVGFEKVLRPWWAGFLTDLVQMRRFVQCNIGKDILGMDLRAVIGPMQLTLRESVPLKDFPRINELWLSHLLQEGVLSDYSGLNWFIPVPYGGLGLDPAGWRSQEITYAQRKLAWRLKEHPDGADKFPLERGIRTTTPLTEQLKRLYGGCMMSGDLVETRDGRKLVVDRLGPTAVRYSRGAFKVSLRAHQLVASKMQETPLVDYWLDYAVDEARVNPEKVKRTVSRWLRWGLNLSDRKVQGHLPEVKQRWMCSYKVEHVEFADIVHG